MVAMMECKRTFVLDIRHAAINQLNLPRTGDSNTL